MPEEQRRKIAESLRGRPKSKETKRAISRSLKKYWKSVVREDE